MKTYNTMIAKLIASLKGQVSRREQILKDHIQGIYDVNLSLLELREYISLAEFEEEDGGEYSLSLTLQAEDLKALTPQEREAFCRDQNTITVNMWIDKRLCKNVDTDNGICNEEAWQYSWHGN